MHSQRDAASCYSQDADGTIRCQHCYSILMLKNSCVQKIVQNCMDDTEGGGEFITADDEGMVIDTTAGLHCTVTESTRGIH